MNEEFKEIIKLCVKLAVITILVIFCFGLLFSSAGSLGDSYELCDNECAKLNLTTKDINYVGGHWGFSHEVESCDCELPAYIRVKVRT